MKQVTYKSSDNSLEIKLKFIVKNRLKYTHLGKTYPKHTQCLMYSNGLLDCFETIVKHNNDEDNQVYAYKLTAEKCMKNISNKWLRGQIRIELNKFLLNQKN